MRCPPLEGLPLATRGGNLTHLDWPTVWGNRFSCSMPAPATSSRHLYTGHRQGGVQGCPLAEGHASGVPLSRGICATPVSMPLCSLSMRQQWYRTCSSSRRTPDPLLAGLFPQRSPRGLLTERSLRWFGLSTCPASPEGQPPSLAQHALWPVDLLHRNHLASGHTAYRRVFNTPPPRNGAVYTFRRRARVTASQRP